jgi:hypothetical protein
MLREALKDMGRADLIGSGKKHLIPAWQPGGPASATERTQKSAQPLRAASGLTASLLAGRRRESTEQRSAPSQVAGKAESAKAPVRDPRSSVPSAKPKAPGGRHPAVPRHPLSQRRGGR